MVQVGTMFSMQRYQRSNGVRSLMGGLEEAYSVCFPIAGTGQAARAGTASEVGMRIASVWWSNTRRFATPLRCPFTT